MEWLITQTGLLWTEAVIYLAFGLALLAALVHIRRRLQCIGLRLASAADRPLAERPSPNSTLEDAAVGAANLLDRLRRLQEVADQLALAAAVHYSGLESTCLEAEARGLDSLARPRRFATRQTEIAFPDDDLDIYDRETFARFYPE